MSADSPREVLEAVRRLEAELEVLRRQARDRQRDAIDLREALSADDLERVVDLIGASWRSTHEQVADLARQVGDLRAFVEDSVGSIKTARLELRLQTAASNGAEA